MKIVFDSNVYLAANKRVGYMHEQLQRAAPSGPYNLFISSDIIVEIREKLEVTFDYDAVDSSRFVKLIMKYATLVYPSRRIVGVLQDADDHIILECAVEAKAEAIVSADKGLLRLKQFEGIKIFHPTMLQYLK